MLTFRSHDENYCVISDVPSWYELCQRGGDQTIPWPNVGAGGQKTKEKW